MDNHLYNKYLQNFHKSTFINFLIFEYFLTMYVKYILLTTFFIRNTLMFLKSFLNVYILIGDKLFCKNIEKSIFLKIYLLKLILNVLESIFYIFNILQ